MVFPLRGSSSLAYRWTSFAISSFASNMTFNYRPVRFLVVTPSPCSSLFPCTMLFQFSQQHRCCVLFPSICLLTASNTDSLALSLPLHVQQDRVWRVCRCVIRCYKFFLKRRRRQLEKTLSYGRRRAEAKRQNNEPEECEGCRTTTEERREDSTRNTQP